jgi:hypothetical protein
LPIFKHNSQVLQVRARSFAGSFPADRKRILPGQFGCRDTKKSVTCAHCEPTLEIPDRALGDFSRMRNHLKLSLLVALAALAISPLAFSQPARSQQAVSSKAQKSTAAPAPPHDISGTWEPANGPLDGIQPMGVKAMPNDGKPEHQLPYTPDGLKIYNSHRPLEGKDAALPAFSTDPRNKCEPLGFPRADLYYLRVTQILQNDYKVAILYQYASAWRVIWTDGRPLPKLVDDGVMVGTELREPRFYGYSVGKWMDENTLVVQTVGMMDEDRVWLDLTGRPISDAARVEEVFHRVNRDLLELTVTIDDPKMYTKPWIAMNKFPMRLADPHTDVTEVYCSPSEMEKYNKVFAEPSSAPASVPGGDAPGGK